MTSLWRRGRVLVFSRWPQRPSCRKCQASHPRKGAKLGLLQLFPWAVFGFRGRQDCMAAHGGETQDVDIKTRSNQRNTQPEPEAPNLDPQTRPLLGCGKFQANPFLNVKGLFFGSYISIPSLTSAKRVASAISDSLVVVHAAVESHLLNQILCQQRNGRF